MRPKFKDLMNCKFTPDGDLDLSRSWWSYTALGKKYVRFYELLDDDRILDALIDAMKEIAPDVEITDRLEKIAYDTDGYEFTELD